MHQIIKSLFALFLVAASLHAAERRPNFIFLIADDHRWDAMGVVQREHGEKCRYPWFETPHMDRLAAEGVRFRNAFITHSICSPGRAGFLSGQYTHINGVMDNNTPFPENAVTHATLLRDAGYQTAYFGKWHMGNQRARPGFDHAASYINQGIYQDCPFEINGVKTPTQGWVDDVTTDLAIGWLKQKHPQPFSMVIGFKSPHNRRGAENLPERLRGLYEGETTRRTPNCELAAIYHKPLTAADLGKERGLSANSVHLDYLRHIKGIDENLGRLLDSLDELKLAEDTVVVYTSDNGYYLGERGLGDKRALYEEGLRIPFLIRYPPHFPKAALVDELVLNIDLAPTYLDLAALPVHPGMQGVSLKKVALGNKPANWRTSFLSCYRKELGDTPTCVGIRTTKAKLIHYHGKPEWTEAFDLIANPYETKNLANDPTFTSKLRNELVQLAGQVGYPLPPELLQRSSSPSDVAGENLPRVLVIGDSISMNYHGAAKAALGGVADYHRIEDNSGTSANGVANTERWLGRFRDKGQQWDVIQLNHGLHDLKQAHDAATQAWGDYVIPLEDYQANLEKQIGMLKQTGAKLIWCSTTPVPNDNPGAYARRKGASKIFNDAALEVMRRHPEILINDLHQTVESSPAFDRWRKGKDVHFYRKEEQKILGDAVAAAVRKSLGGPEKALPIAGEVFLVQDRTAFLILPENRDPAKPTPWVWYAPTLPKLPAVEEKWMFEKFLAAGIAIAGIDVGESMGNPAGRAHFSALHAELVGKRGMSPKACLLARSRGGLMLYNWAAENPQWVAAIAGVYPVGDLASWPGLGRASGAYGQTAEQLAEQLANHNPIDRLAPLAKAGVPIFHLHGDSDTVVPLERNSGLIKQRYDAMGGQMTLEVIEGGGHDMNGHWFQSQTLVDFVIRHLATP